MHLQELFYEITAKTHLILYNSIAGIENKYSKAYFISEKLIMVETICIYFV